MTATEVLRRLLKGTVDAPYTILNVSELRADQITIIGHYNLEQGRIEDQLRVGLKTYFRIKEVVTTLNPEPDGWYAYSAKLVRQPWLARFDDIAEMT